jgi:alpha-tubulin suppressor-like RCC1 family protein
VSLAGPVCWGSGAHGELEGAAREPVLRITAGGDHTCVLGISARVVCVGDNSLGQLGSGAAAGPVPVAGLAFRRVSAGSTHSCGVTLAGAAYCWGAGPLGSAAAERSATPVPVSGALRFDAVEANAAGRHVCGVATTGRVYCWGANEAGQLLGNGTLEASRTPVAVGGALAAGVAAVQLTR